MSARMREVLGRTLVELRHEPTAKRVRGFLDDTLVVDTDRAVLVWEPRRVVPTYAVPLADLGGEVLDAGQGRDGEDDIGFPLPDLGSRPVLDPRVPFAVHSTEGRPVTVTFPGGSRAVAGFLPADPDLAGLVILDFAGVDLWLEDADRVVSHPHDPYSRIDIRTSSRRVQVAVDGRILADSTRAMLLYETLLPVRFYFPPDDVLVELEPSDTRSWCAYKGEASYSSVRMPDRLERDIAWRYESPLDDALRVSGQVAFFDERVDIVVDGAARARPITPWSQRATDR
ncbi:DUF427 domain-containing protein [Lacisediminihabitans profunda]|uniref:DUF427 domain-containing protein n=1 Tax=Lacisediminihabitans profunda TaxID=2594790 RepID=A0A5C8UNW9_9MICO|nr:DUF427 domain-containing protein [Lacisediminihabitans profunda]TXN29007.1 DUF427 domain-containing protein [Lacisediminihabitans profunda]